jgi:hypothetical protein
MLEQAFFSPKMHLNFKKKIVSFFSQGNAHGAGEFQHPSVGRHLFPELPTPWALPNT